MTANANNFLPSSLSYERTTPNELTRVRSRPAGHATGVSFLVSSLASRENQFRPGAQVIDTGRQTDSQTDAYCKVIETRK